MPQENSNTIDNNIQSAGTNQLPELKPIEIPGQDLSPSIGDRLALIEQVLNLNS